MNSIFKVGDKVSYHDRVIENRFGKFSKKDDKEFGKVFTVKEICRSEAGNVLYFVERRAEHAFDFEVFFDLSQEEANKRLRESESKWFQLRDDIDKIKRLLSYITPLQKEIETINSLLNRLEEPK